MAKNMSLKIVSIDNFPNILRQVPFSIEFRKCFILICNIIIHDVNLKNTSQ